MLSRPQNLKQLYDIRNKISHDISKLQLIVLPQPKLIMLHDRAQELLKYLHASTDQIIVSYSSKKATETCELVQDLCRLLEELSRIIAHNLGVVESQISYTQFPRLIANYKKEARELAAKLAKFTTDDEEIIVEKFSNQWTTLASAVQALGDMANRVNLWAQPKFETAIQSIHTVFNMLDKHPSLADIQNRVQTMLNESAYHSINNSEMFDPQFYTNQLPKTCRNIDNILDHYINNKNLVQPHRFFDPRMYNNTYPEVKKLRYVALEHFIRYGETMNYRPCNEFDTTYYMESNEDVVEAGFPPLRHFLQHGLQEGRPPCPKAGLFFIKQYLKPTTIRLGFINTSKDSTHMGWDQLRSHCATRSQCLAEDIDAEIWSGHESGFDAFVIGSHGVSLLQGDLLQTVAASSSLILYIGDNPQEDLDKLLHQKTLPLERLCAVTSNYEQFLRWQESVRPLKLRYYDFTDPERDTPFIEALLHRLAKRQGFALRRVEQWDRESNTKPSISIVSIIYKKSREMKAFLESLNRQDLARPFEVILVDDASPDDSVEQIEQWLAEKQHHGLLNAHMTVRIVRNPANSGNCTSRNRGVEASLADVVLVADGDVVMSTTSLSEHVLAYRQDDCDAVIGFFKFNMDYHEVFQWLAASETNAEIVRAQILLDTNSYICQLPNSIYNFVTRNTSFKKSAFKDGYFDTSFNYTSDINSGYGEEDHEIAARLYFNKKNIRFIEKSICVHIRHGDNSYNANKAISNLRNWNRLIDKHPDLTLVDRQYYQWRTKNLLIKTSSRPNAPEVESARKRYENPNRANIVVPRVNPLRILTNKCNIPYQYDLFKMRHFFTMLDGLDPRVASGWDYELRPCPYNVDFTSFDGVNTALFDIAILNFDLGKIFRDIGSDSLHHWAGELIHMLELTRGMPRIALCHITSLTFRNNDDVKDPLLITKIKNRKAVLRTLLKDVHVVCTSYQLQREWNFTKSSVIWHGFSPQEYPEGTHESICLTLPHKEFVNSSLETLRYLETKLSDVCPLEFLAPPLSHSGHVDSKQNRAVASYQNYAKYLGRFAVHLTPFDRPYMPQSRTEAMLTGTIPFSLRTEDSQIFIQDGVNGFIGDSVEELSDHIRLLLKNDKLRRQICRNARLTAMDVFNIDRCIASWLDLIQNIA